MNRSVRVRDVSFCDRHRNQTNKKRKRTRSDTVTYPPSLASTSMVTERTVELATFMRSSSRQPPHPSTVAAELATNLIKSDP